LLSTLYEPPDSEPARRRDCWRLPSLDGRPRGPRRRYQSLLDRLDPVRLRRDDPASLARRLRRKSSFFL